MAGTVSDDVIRYQDFEGAPTFTSIGGGAGAAKETVTFFQGAASGSRKIASVTYRGFLVNNDTAVSPSVLHRLRNDYAIPSPVGYDQDITLPHRVWMAKVLLTDGQDLNALGLEVGLGDSGNYNMSRLIDDGTLNHRYMRTYPPTESWLVVPSNISTFFDPGFDGGMGAGTGRGGSAEGSSIMYCTGFGGASIADANQFVVQAAVATGAAKSENLFLDSCDISDGLYVIGGTESPDAPAVFNDFPAYDEDDINNRIGHALTKEGVIFYYGFMVIGRTGTNSSPFESPQPTFFRDSNAQVVGLVGNTSFLEDSNCQ